MGDFFLVFLLDDWFLVRNLRIQSRVFGFFVLLVRADIELLLNLVTQLVEFVIWLFTDLGLARKYAALILGYLTQKFCKLVIAINCGVAFFIGGFVD